MNTNLILRIIFSIFIFSFSSAFAQTAQDYVHLGNVSGKQEKYKEAIKNYTKAIKISPYELSAFYNRGYIYIKMRKYKLAITDLDEAIEINPRYAPAYHLRGIAFFYKKMYGQAIENYSEAIKLDPRNMRYYNSRLGVYFRLGYADRAWKDVIKIQELGGTVDPTIVNMLKDKRYRE